MFTGPVGPVEVFFYWPLAILGIFYWPGAIGPLLVSSPGRVLPYILVRTWLSASLLKLNDL